VILWTHGSDKKVCVCVHMHAPLPFFNPVLIFGIIFYILLGKLAVEIIKEARVRWAQPLGHCW